MTERDHPGPASARLAAGESLEIELLKNVMAPLTHADGTAKSALQPYRPVMNPCVLCPGRCCRLAVKLSLADALHYCAVLDVPFFAGITIAQSPRAEHSFRLDADPRFVAPELKWNGNAELRLRRTDDGACHALVNIGGYDRCGVYAARPMVCRTYPVSWTSVTAKGAPEAILCPVPYGIGPAEEAQVRADIETSILRWERHDKIVAAWNATEIERTVEQFLAFALPLAAQDEGIDAARLLQGGSVTQRLYDAMLDSGVLKAPAVPLPKAKRPFAGLPE